ncbi:MAG: hypothetical protein ACRDQU_16285 [Pseudonocardiaceae bacterium]
MPERTTRRQAELAQTYRSPTTAARPVDPEGLSTLGLGLLTQRHVTAMQRTVGNRAVSSILRQLSKAEHGGPAVGVGVRIAG